MRDYEAMLLTRPQLDEEATQALVDRFKTLITENAGEVTEIDKWGKRRLAYEVQDQREGVYTLIKFKGEARTAHELERVLRITDDVMKYLIVRTDEK